MNRKTNFLYQDLKISEPFNKNEAGVHIKTEEDVIEQLPIRRLEDFHDIGRKKTKRLPVSYEDWQPFSKVLQDLAEKNDFNGSPAEVLEQQNLALKMTTPEGLQEIIDNLEEKLSKYEDMPPDPEFERLSINEKIDNLFKDLSSN